MIQTLGEGRRVLVTGVSGFVGSQVAYRCCDDGAYVVGLARDVNKIDPYFGLAKTYRGDICDHDLLRNIIAYEEIDTIFHFAANAIVRTSARDPMSTYSTNVMGTVALLEAARIVGGLKSIVVASSDKAYGDHDELPYVESHALQPNNTYDTSKACMDMISRTYGKNYDMPIVVTRCSNIYGPGDENISRIVPNTIRRALEGKPALVYSDVESMEREFIFIDDVVDAYMILGFDPDVSRVGNALNIGGTGPVKIYDLVKLIGTLVGLKEDPIVERRDPRFREIKRQYIDAHAMNLLGWKPQTSLEKGIEITIDWYRDFL